MEQRETLQRSRTMERKRKRRKKRILYSASAIVTLLLASTFYYFLYRTAGHSVETALNKEEAGTAEGNGAKADGTAADPDERLPRNSELPTPGTVTGERPAERDANGKKETARITFSFAGDTMAAGKVAPILTTKGYQYPWKAAKPLLETSDIAMVNLETSVSFRGAPEEKEYVYRSHPDLLRGAKWAGVDIVTVANNHSLDYGRTAFTDTLGFLQDFAIAYVGGGRNEQEAYARKEMTVRGEKISFLAFSRVLPSFSWYPGKERAGLASGYQKERVYALVSEAAAAADITVVYMHWGEELADHPDPEEREMARRLIDLGADLVIGSHPHVWQGLEWYKGKLIAYSLGNFIFTTSFHEMARRTGVLQVAIDEDGKQSARLIPLKIDQGAVWQPAEAERNEIIERVASLSVGGKWGQDGRFILP
ncbi:hypothetical protein BSNK01_25870 [Bacillaceae bacterium]